MVYASNTDIENHSQVTQKSLGLSEVQWNELLDEIRSAVQRFIDKFCNVPSNFFDSQQTFTKTYDLKQKTRDNLPILFLLAPITITKLEYSEVGLGQENWKTLTEGRDKDYIYDSETGIIYFCKPFQTGIQRVRVTFKCGYSSVPSDIRTITAELSGRLLNIINQRREGFIGTIGPVKVEKLPIEQVFTPELKELLLLYKQKLVV